jgi:hypothetical protein
MLRRKGVLQELIRTTVWLAGDLVELLEKIGFGANPSTVIDLALRIRDAEIRVETIRERWGGIEPMTG